MRSDQASKPSNPRLVYVLMLLTAAFIFGFSFVVMQRASVHLSAFAFNGLTWLCGGLVVLPLVKWGPTRGNGAPVFRKGTTIYCLILGGAFCWSAHFHVLSWAGNRLDSTRIMLAQCMLVGGISMVLALFRGELDVNAIAGCTWEILYAGFIFVGLGSLMEVHGIRHLPPSMGAVVLSLESVFAVLAGWLVLGETMSSRAMVGCALMFSAIFIVQLRDAGARTDDRGAPSKASGGHPRPA